MVQSVTAQLEGEVPVKTRPAPAEEMYVSTTLSCGQCGAPLRAEQDWCSLCYAIVQPEFDPLTAPLDEVVGQSGPVAPADAGPVAEPDLVDGAAEAEQVVEAPDFDVMLSMLAAEHRRSDPAAGIVERLEDKSTRIAVMVGGMAIIGAVVFLVLTVLGAIA